MNHELAKKLKDAGFPIKESRNIDLFNEEGLGKYIELYSDLNFSIVPTLEDLIDACEHFAGVQRRHNKWQAIAFPSPRIVDNQLLPMIKGKNSLTPVEAVAELWLELHKLPAN